MVKVKWFTSRYRPILARIATPLKAHACISGVHSDGQVMFMDVPY